MKAEKALLPILKRKNDHPAALFVIILNKFISKRLNEAKGYLKVHGKMGYDPQYGEELEKG